MKNAITLAAVLLWTAFQVLVLGRYRHTEDQP